MPLPEASYFGDFGGQFVPETVMPALEQLEEEYAKVRSERSFNEELEYYFKYYVGRPTPLYFARRLTERLGGAQIFLKREDLNHTGAHKINNTIGQALLAKRMGKGRVIAETGAGQHGVATATAAALFDMECQVFMGEEDIKRQELNVFRMEMLGARVTPVTSGSRTLKDATNEAIRDWVTNINTTHYIIGSVVGPHPYPTIVRDLQSVIGEEIKAQCLEILGKPPDCLVACIGGGSNAMGTFYPFTDSQVRLIGVEAAGIGIETGRHAASLSAGSRGVLHGMCTYLLQDENGQIIPAHSISAGLDYPGVGPEHSFLKDTGRAEYFSVTDSEALEAFQMLVQNEGIIPALESAHALAHVVKMAPRMRNEEVIVVTLSGRGDKDVQALSQILKEGGS